MVLLLPDFREGTFCLFVCCCCFTFFQIRVCFVILKLRRITKKIEAYLQEIQHLTKTSTGAHLK